MSDLDGINIAMMPLHQNVPTPSNEDWQLTICPECGRECWRMGENADFIEQLCPGTLFLCTECALRIKWKPTENQRTERCER